MSRYGQKTRLTQLADNANQVGTWFGVVVTPPKNRVDFLVVAGGGSGGKPDANLSAGGGAGGLRSSVTATGGGGSLETTLICALNTPFTVTVGAGGAVQSTSQTAGNNGTNSVFGTITSTFSPDGI